MAHTTSPPHHPAAALVVGLVGAIGSGKSAVAAAFARRGAVVVSGDVAGHEALRQPEIRKQVVQRWGRDLLDDKGEINRRKLAAIVFNEPAERRALEALVFPWIEKRLRERIGVAKMDPSVPLIILDAAVMLEAGWNEECDRLLFVDAPTPLRVERLAEGRGWTEKEVRNRERAQLPSNEKRIRADAILDNSGTLGELQQRVEEILKHWGIEDQERTRNEKARTGDLPNSPVHDAANENEP
jgi:dephospho-CoA kinase